MSTAYGQAGNWRTLSVVSGLHVVAALALLSTEPVANAVGLPQPLMVSLLAISEPEPPKALPKPLPPKSQPQPVQQVQPPPVLAVQTEAPSPIAVQIPPAPLPIPAVLPAPAPEPVKLTIAAAVAVPPAPAPITPPRFDADYQDNPAPSYPALSRRTGEYGRVLLRVYVSPDGVAAQVEIRESSGYDRLDRAARDTVQRWRFVPAKQGERGIAAWVLVPISFSLRS